MEKRQANNHINSWQIERSSGQLTISVKCQLVVATSHPVDLMLCECSLASLHKCILMRPFNRGTLNRFAPCIA